VSTAHSGLGLHILEPAAARRLPQRV